MSALNVFVAERNVDIYLSKLHNGLNPSERDVILRLLVKEEGDMGLSREHVDNGERRVIDGRQRVKRHRILVADLSLKKRLEHPENARLETLGWTQ